MYKEILPIKLQTPVFYIYLPIKTLGRPGNQSSQEIDDWIYTLSFFSKVDMLAAYDLAYYIRYNNYKDEYNVTHHIEAAEGGKTKPQSVIWDKINQSFLLWMNAEKMGLDKAQFVLGAYYYYGKEKCPKSESAAVVLWEKAALQGLSLAQFNLGCCYFLGIGIEQDMKEAVEWWKKAADQKNHYAINNLGYCYYNGQGVPKDINEAVRLWNSVATNKYYTDMQFHNEEDMMRRYQNVDDFSSCTLPLYNLGCCYYYGHGVQQSNVEALELWKLSLQDPNMGDVAMMLGYFYRYGIVANKDFDQSIRCYGAATFSNLFDIEDKVKIHILIGDCYCDYDNPTKKIDEAIKKYKWAIENHKNPEAMYKLSVLYRLGLGVNKNFTEANALLKQSYDLGYTIAAAEIGKIYLEGQGVTISIPEALKWINLAIDHGDFEAHFLLGTLYENGKGVIQDFRKAADLFLRASEHKNPEAQYKMGEFFYNGKGVEQDFEKAYYWLLLASANGNVEATLLRDLCLSRLTKSQIESIQSQASLDFAK